METQLDRIERLLQEHIRSSSAWREATDRRIDENTEITQGIRDRKGIPMMMMSKVFESRLRRHLIGFLVPFGVAVLLLYAGGDLARAFGRQEIAVWCSIMAGTLFGVAATHPLRLLLMPWFDLGAWARTAREQGQTGHVVLGACIVLAALLFSLTGAARASELPTLAHQHLPTLLAEQRAHWPGMPDPAILAGQVEQESCITLRHPRCWSPRSELRTSHERGVGLGQITRTARFDALAEMRAAHSDKLGAWSWDDDSLYDPALQLRALVLMDLGHWQAITGAATWQDRMAFALASYNGGRGGTMKRRMMCRGTKGCDEGRWWGHAEHTDWRAKKALPGYGKSFSQINSEYPTQVMHRRAPRYMAWFTSRS